MTKPWQPGDEVQDWVTEKMDESRKREQECYERVLTDPALPEYLRHPVFRRELVLHARMKEMADRLKVWVAEIGEEAAAARSHPNGKTPAETLSIASGRAEQLRARLWSKA